MDAPRGFLAELTPEQRDTLLARGAKRRYVAGRPLFQEGDRSDSVVVLLGGRVKVSYFTEDGREVVLAIRGPGALIGELSAIDGLPRSAGATALDDVDALIVPADGFRDFLATNPGVALALMQMLAEKVRDADRKRIEFAAYDTVGRVASRLVELAERFGDSSHEGVRITLPLSQQELAGWTGSSREAVTKALHTLRSRGCIQTHRRGITVIDLEELRRRAE